MWSDEDYHNWELADHIYSDHTSPLTEYSAAEPSPEETILARLDRRENVTFAQSSLQKIRGIVTEKQYRRIRMYCEGMTYREIAEVEGVSAKNVFKSVMAGKKKISKILEKLDIADVLLPNIHIDARVIFDEKYIFIPKSHFKLEITPDIYVVLKLDKSFNHVEFLGYFEPKKINKKNANSNYYFITKNKLSSPDTLKQYIKNFTGSTSRKISEEDMLRGRELSISLADHITTEDEEKEMFGIQEELLKEYGINR